MMRLLYVTKTVAITAAICILLVNIYTAYNQSNEGAGYSIKDMIDALQQKFKTLQDNQHTLRRDLLNAVHHFSSENDKLVTYIKEEGKGAPDHFVLRHEKNNTAEKGEEKGEFRKVGGNEIKPLERVSSTGKSPNDMDNGRNQKTPTTSEPTTESAQATSETIGTTEENSPTHVTTKEQATDPTISTESTAVPSTAKAQTTKPKESSKSSIISPTVNVKTTEQSESTKDGLSKEDIAAARAACEVPKVDPFNPVVTQFVKKLPKLKCNGTVLSRIEDDLIKFDVKNVKGAAVIWIDRYYDFWLDFYEWVSFTKSLKRLELKEALNQVGCIGFGENKHITDKLRVTDKPCTAQNFFHFKSDGRINVLHKESCIFVSEPKVNGKVDIEKKCSTNESQFSIAKDSTLKHIATGLCLTIENHAGKLDDQRIMLASCNTTAATFYFIEPQNEDVKAEVPVKQDCFKVLFVFKNNTFHVDFHLYAAPIPEDKLPKIDPKNKGKGLKSNIAFVMFDSQSNANFHRSMQRSMSFMKSDKNTVIFKAQTVVGDATSPQLVAMLTGKRITDLPEARRNIKGAGYIDDWPFIFKDLHQNGYVTQFAEDDPLLGAFNLRFWGFFQPPTVHYGRPYWLDAMPHCIGYLDTQFCIGDRSLHRINMDYMMSLYKTQPGKRKFTLIMHSKLVHGNFFSVQRADGDIVQLLSQTKGRGLLNDTILVVLGDHGARYGPLRETIQGKIEERLPFLSITLPERIAEEYPDLLANMKRNSHLLTSHFDIYATLKHILSYPSLPTGIKFGNSLFTRLNASRSCEEIGVPELWCPCLTFEEVSVSDPMATKVATKAVDYMNDLIGQDENLVKICARVELDRITHIGKKIPNKRIQRYYYSDSDKRCATCKIVEWHKDVFKDILYEVSFITKPGGGKFEAVVLDFGDGTMKVKNGISRINKYGTQARCVEKTYPHVRKYCFCK